MDREAAVRRQFDRAAAAYGTSAVFAQGHDLARMVEATAPMPAMTVLDVGCAAGHTAFAFAPHVREVVGVDLSRGMLAEAARLAAARGIANVRWDVGVATALPYADGAFDIVACRLVLHHLPALASPLAEMARVLKPGGQLVIVDTVAPEDPALDRLINEIEVLRDPSHARDYTIAAWHAAGAAAGVPLVALHEWFLPLDFADWIARQQTPPEATTRIIRLMDNAAAEARAAFAFDPGPPRTFRLWAALFRGVKGGGQPTAGSRQRAACRSAPTCAVTSSSISA